jgi:ATP/maltotriose-dependent transcriptional regulator MalT
VLPKEVAETRGITTMLEALAEYERLGDRNGMAMALENLGTFSGWLREIDAARRYQEQSLAIRRELGDKPGIAISARYLSRLALQTGDCTAARDLSEECLAVERELGRPTDEAEALGFLAQVSMTEGNFDEARELLLKGIALHRRRQDGSVPPWLLNALADVGIASRDFVAARATLEELAAGARERDQPGILTGALSKLSLVALAEGRADEVLAHAAEALTVPKAQENRWVLSALGEAVAGVAVGRGDFPGAAQVLGAADGVRRDAGPHTSKPHLSPEHDDNLDAARVALGDDAFTVAWSSGDALGMDGLAELLADVAGVTLPARQSN